MQSSLLRRHAVPDAPRFLERARTWLLAVGWRKHGLIDPLEVPVGAELSLLGTPR